MAALLISPYGLLPCVPIPSKSVESASTPLGTWVHGSAHRGSNVQTEATGMHLIEATLLLLFLTTIAVPWAGKIGLPTEILLVLGSLALSLVPGLPPLILDPT